RLAPGALLHEPARDHRLPERVVQLVRARVHEVFPLQVETLSGSESLRERERRRPARVADAELVHLRAKLRVVPQRLPGRHELVERRDQRFGDVTAAVRSVESLVAPVRPASPYARTASGSFTPGPVSSRELASTAHGRTLAIASRTLSAARPPASITRPCVARARSSCVASSSCQGRSITVATRSAPRNSTAPRLRWPLSRS